MASANNIMFTRCMVWTAFVRKHFIHVIIVSIFLTKTIIASGIDIVKLSTPTITSYSRMDYNASTQNWSITQDQNGIMWFGNIGNALWFDGEEWGRVTIPNTSIVTSLITLSDGKVVAGVYRDFGSLEKTSTGDYNFVSWMESIPEKLRVFSHIWKMYELNNILYLHSYERIFKFKDGKYLGSIEPENQFKFSFVSNGRLYVQDTGYGLKVLLDTGLILVEKGDFFKDMEIWYVGHLNGRLMVATQNEGAFLFENGQWHTWNTEANALLRKYKLFSALQLENSAFIFGTVQGGVILCDFNGKISKIINKKRGLQNNTVLSLYVDSKKNLWLGLDRGIDYVLMNTPFSSLTGEEGFGTGYGAIEYHGKIYLGTNQGIYTWSDSKKDFTLLENSTGQVWSFEIIQDQLYCFHNNGIFKITGTKAELLFNMKGAWKIEQVPNQDKYYIVGSYDGLHRVQFGDRPQAIKISGFNESSRIFEFDTTGNLWMSHGYEGVFKVRLSSDYLSCDLVVYFGPNQGLPSKNHNEVFKYNNEIIVAADDGFYRYNDIIGLMQAYDKWNNLIKLNHPISKVIEDQWGRVHFFNTSKLIWAYIENDSLTHIDSTTFLPISNDFFYSFENIYYLTQDEAIIGTVDGFSLYNREHQLTQDSKLKIFVKRVYSIGGIAGSQYRKAIKYDSNTLKLPFSRDNIYIELSVPVYQNHDDIIINYNLNGEQQPRGLRDNQIVLQNLNIGRSQLDIFAVDPSLNIQSDHLLMNFIILPPWYKRWYAFFAYGLILLIGFYISFRLYRIKLESVKRKEKIAQTRKMFQKERALREQAEKAEKELIIIRNEKLKSENRIKAEEIANSTMELVHKNKILLDVKYTLSQIQKERDIDIRNSKIKGMLRKIDRDLNNEENWKIFEQNFDEVHENFLNRIKEKHPVLTSKDLRLCAYLRMNLSSKEIAPLLRISARSVEISRYRLRKKMDLEHDANLSDYILSQ